MATLAHSDGPLWTNGFGGRIDSRHERVTRDIDVLGTDVGEGVDLEFGSSGRTRIYNPSVNSSGGDDSSDATE